MTEGSTPSGVSRRDNLVVDVGDVARVDEAGPSELVPEQPGERIEHHRGPRVADMRTAVNGRPADIHRDPLGIGRDELAFLTRQSVMKADHFACPGWRRA